MAFVGIITDNESTLNLKKRLFQNSGFKKHNTIFITEKNIDNVKNIKFDTIFINREFEKKETLRKLLKNSNYVVINIDISIDLKFLEDIEIKSITFGFNSKSTVTISSITDENVLICIQRSICNDFGEIPLQEININKSNQDDIYDIIIVLIYFLIYNYNVNKEDFKIM